MSEPLVTKYCSLPKFKLLLAHYIYILNIYSIMDMYIYHIYILYML